jgi:hypothetical protein
MAADVVIGRMFDDSTGDQHQLGIHRRCGPFLHNTGVYAFQLQCRLRSDCVSRSSAKCPDAFLTMLQWYDGLYHPQHHDLECRAPE